MPRSAGAGRPRLDLAMQLKGRIGIILVCTMTVVSATGTAAQEDSIDCEDEANRDNPDCLGLPDDQAITNFVPLIAPLLGAAALAGIGGAAGSTVSTTSTTSTTN